MLINYYNLLYIFMRFSYAYSSFSIVTSQVCSFCSLLFVSPMICLACCLLQSSFKLYEQLDLQLSLPWMPRPSALVDWDLTTSSCRGTFVWSLDLCGSRWFLYNTWSFMLIHCILADEPNGETPRRYWSGHFRELWLLKSICCIVAFFLQNGQVYLLMQFFVCSCIWP